MSQSTLRLSPSGPYADMAAILAEDGVGFIRGIYARRNSGAIVISSTRVYDCLDDVEITIADEAQLQRTRVAVFYELEARMDGTPAVVLFSPTLERNAESTPNIMEAPAFRALDDSDTPVNTVCKIGYNFLKGYTGSTPLGVGAPMQVGTNRFNVALQGADTVSDGDVDGGYLKMLLVHVESGLATSLPN